MEASLQMDERLITLPTKNFMYAGLALCYLAIGRPLKAAEYLDQSLAIAGRDKNYTFLASFRKYFSALFRMPSVSGKHRDTIREIRFFVVLFFEGGYREFSGQPQLLV